MTSHFRASDAKKIATAAKRGQKRSREEREKTAVSSTKDWTEIEKTLFDAAVGGLTHVILKNITPQSEARLLGYGFGLTVDAESINYIRVLLNERIEQAIGDLPSGLKVGDEWEELDSNNIEEFRAGDDGEKLCETEDLSVIEDLLAERSSLHMLRMRPDDYDKLPEDGRKYPYPAPTGSRIRSALLTKSILIDFVMMYRNWDWDDWKIPNALAMYWLANKAGQIFLAKIESVVKDAAAKGNRTASLSAGRFGAFEDVQCPPAAEIPNILSRLGYTVRGTKLTGGEFKQGWEIIIKW